MAREGTGEETRRQIIEVSKRLFMEKGYDNTTIKEIVDGLGGLTKGVIYHHFKSKQDIFEHVMRNYSDLSMLSMNDGNTGLEKIRNLLINELRNVDKQSLAYSSQVLLKTPRIIGEQYQTSFSELVPMIKEMVNEGIEDQSIQTEYPQEVSELLVIVFNIWLGIQLNLFTKEEAIRKIYFFKEIFDALSVPLIDDEAIIALEELMEYLKK